MLKIRNLLYKVVQIRIISKYSERSLECNTFTPTFILNFLTEYFWVQKFFDLNKYINIVVEIVPQMINFYVKTKIFSKTSFTVSFLFQKNTSQTYCHCVNWYVLIKILKLVLSCLLNIRGNKRFIIY